MSRLELLLQAIRGCTHCVASLPLGPRPVVQADEKARVLLIGQAPGLRVHETGIPWNDASGRRLRQWLNISEEDFYDAQKLAIAPMGFCYPGRGKHGDLPPRPECAPQWHQSLLDMLPNIELTLLVGQYAQQYYLSDLPYRTLTERVQNWRELPQNLFVLPHPSPRNQIWLKRNPWFEQAVIPQLQQRITRIFG